MDMSTLPTLRCRTICEMFTSSQAIQQSHFFTADKSWAKRMSTVTQESR